MKKIGISLSLSLALFGASTFAGTGGDAVYIERANWTGLYVGGNAGYFWSANNFIHNRGHLLYTNPLLPNASEIANALLLLSTSNLDNSISGFIGGGQLGYNNQFSEKLVIGAEADIDAAGNPSRTSTLDRTFTTAQSGTYSANIVETRKIDYLGLLKGRLGYLITPSFLLYGTGAFAYGGAKLASNYNITQSQTAFLPISVQTNKTKMLAGWAAGAGVEWLLTPFWSMKAEYIYYNLGPLNNDLNLNQYLATTPPTSFAGAYTVVGSHFTLNTVRVGLNYHFG